MSRHQIDIVGLILTILICVTTSAAHATPTLTMHTTVVQPGEIVTLYITDFDPGGVAGTVMFDYFSDFDFYIPTSGALAVSWTVPADAALGGHDLYVCAACGQGDLEEATNTIRLTVVSGEMTGSEFNLQPWGIEINQGVRGDFAVRTPPDGSFELPNESVVHVANRRALVRVYPWVEGGPDFVKASFIRAKLWATRDGVTYGPIYPVYRTVQRIYPGATIEDMRSDMRRTWNFYLPSEVLSLDNAETSGSFELMVEVNPAEGGQSRECDTCYNDNTFVLDGNEVQHVGLTGNYTLKFRPHLVEASVTQADSSVNFLPRVTFSQMRNTIRSLYRMLPLPDGNRGVRLMPWRGVDWSGTQDDWDPAQDEFLISTYLPGGVLHGGPPNDYYAFLYDGSGGRGGHANLFTPFLRTTVGEATDYVAAHELNHAIGAPHAGNGHGEAEGGGYDHAYPGWHGDVESDSWGVNVYSGLLIPPKDFGSEIETHDFMSYGPGRLWVSRYTWDLTAENLGTPEIDPGKSLPFFATKGEKTGTVSYVAFRGLFESGSPMNLAPFFSSWALTGGSGGGQTGGQGNGHGGFGDGTYQVEFSDASGTPLSFLTPALNRPQDLDQSFGIFAESIAVPDDWQYMDLREGNNLVQTWTRSANPPQVNTTAPVANFHWPNTGITTISWTATDLDGDDLVFRVLAQQTNANELIVLDSNLTANSFDLDLASLPSGGDWTVVVEASDGFDNVMAPAVQGWVDPTPPQVMIPTPSPGEIFVAGQVVPVVALVADLQGEIPDSDVDWFLDGSWVGEGASFELPDVSVGTHQLLASVYNNLQIEGNDSVQFEVISQLEFPQLVGPTDGAIGLSRTVFLDWQPVPGAVSYRLQLSDNANFDEAGGMVAEAGNIADDEQTIGFPEEIGSPIYWRIMAEHLSAPSGWSQARSFSFADASAVAEEIPAPAKDVLSAYPNPFNPATMVAFTLEKPGTVSLEIYDPAGRLVRTLFNGHREAGHHELIWNGKDGHGLQPGSGVYLIRLVTPQQTISRSVLLLK